MEATVRYKKVGRFIKKPNYLLQKFSVSGYVFKAVLEKMEDRIILNITDESGEAVLSRDNINRFDKATLFLGIRDYTKYGDSK